MLIKGIMAPSRTMDHKDKHSHNSRCRLRLECGASRAYDPEWSIPRWLRLREFAVRCYWLDLCEAGPMSDRQIRQWPSGPTAPIPSSGQIGYPITSRRWLRMY